MTTTAGINTEGLYDKDLNPIHYKVKALARSYALATAGTPTKQKFDVDTGEYELKFIHKDLMDGDDKVPSVIFLSKEYYYPLENNGGFNFSLKHGDTEL